MRRLLNRVACWLIGHEWREYGYFNGIVYIYKCIDCGKIREYER